MIFIYAFSVAEGARPPFPFSGHLARFLVPFGFPISRLPELTRSALNQKTGETEASAGGRESQRSCGSSAGRR